MNIKEFIESYGDEESYRVAKKAGTNLVYFKQLASGHRKPSSKLAWKLVFASDSRLSFDELLPPPPEVSFLIKQG